MNGKFKIKGRLKAEKDGEVIFEKNNMILSEGQDLLIRVITNESTESIESIAVGDDGTDVSESDDDLIGDQINETSVEDPYDSSTDTGYELYGTYTRFIAKIENTSGDTVTHREAVLTNNYDAEKDDRDCLSRVDFERDVTLEDDEAIVYTWDIYFEILTKR